MMSISHWGMFEVAPPNTLIWPRGFKVSVSVEQFRSAMRLAGVSRVVMDHRDIDPAPPGFRAPQGFRLPSAAEVAAQARRPNGIIRLLPTVEKQYAKYMAELYRAGIRPDFVPTDIKRCAVRFLYRCHREGA